jgi:uncharacterized membrane protein YphA (DoxX/SURF4 family)
MLSDMDSTTSVRAKHALALVRIVIGAMFVWVFFENYGKGLYTPAGYANLIDVYATRGHAPEAWKSVMRLMAANAAVAAPLQATAEISFGVLLLLGLLTPPVAFAAFGFLTSLWVSEWGTAWIWELLVPMGAALAVSLGAAGRTWGIDGLLARRKPDALWW